VALPHGAVRPGQPVDRGQPAAHPDPPARAALEELYRQRGAVERENGRLKNEWALLPLRVPRMERVRLHADLTMLARLATALAKART
jgi:hypothetical protein